MTSAVTNHLGIMQGRLSPPMNGKIQAFPHPYWQEEFFTARQLGLACMEWIYEFPGEENNPLCTNDGIADIQRLCRENNIAVNSLIADYFMTKPLFGKGNKEIKNNIEKLSSLFVQCHKCGIKLIELPFVDDSAITTDDDFAEVVDNLRNPLTSAVKMGLKISFETSLHPVQFKKLLEAFAPLHIYANYDMGNSASLGFDPAEEFRLFGDRIINVHIKDRIKNGGTVPLGKGNTDFKTVFRLLKEYKYSGEYILQAARQDIGGTDCKKDIEDTMLEYIGFVNKFL